MQGPPPGLQKWVGLLGGALSLFGLIHLLFFSQETYQPNQITIVSGRVADVYIIERLRSANTLNLRLDSNPILYRWNIGNPRSRVDSPLRFLRSAFVEIGVRPVDLQAPYRDFSRREDFVPVYSLKAGGTVIFSLEDYNRWSADNMKVGKIVFSIMFLSGVWLYLDARRRPTKGMVLPKASHSQRLGHR